MATLVYRLIASASDHCAGEIQPSPAATADRLRRGNGLERMGRLLRQHHVSEALPNAGAVGLYGFDQQPQSGSPLSSVAARVLPLPPQAGTEPGGPMAAVQKGGQNPLRQHQVKLRVVTRLDASATTG